MRYINLENPGHHSHLAVTTMTVPIGKPSQILVQVKATALNRADLMQRKGNYPPPQGESNVLGLEVAGDVVSVGEEVNEFKVGDRVYGLVGSGGYAEYCLVEATLAHRIPDDMDYLQAAAIPEALTTVYATLFDIGALKAGQTLLIHGAGSGISSFAIQMAKLLGAKVITTVGTAGKMAKALALGADQVIDYNKNDFEDLIEEQSIDLIIDYVGGDYFNKHLHLLKPDATLIQLACMKGSTVDCNLAIIMRKRLKIIGFVLRSQSILHKSKLWKSAHQEWNKAIKDKQLKPIIDSIFEFDDIAKAHEYFQTSTHFGKIVIRV